MANHNALNHRNASLQTLAAAEAKGDKATLSLIWQSLLAEVGVYLVKTADKWGGIVVRSTEHGILRYRCKSIRIGETLELDFTEAADKPIVYDYVADHRAWQAMEISVRGPGDTITGYGTVVGVPKVILVGGKGLPLKEFGIRRGLPNFTGPLLKRLVKHEKVPFAKGKMPGGDHELIKELGKQCLKASYTDEVYKKSLTKRVEKATDVEELLEQSPLQTGDIADILTEDLQDEELEEELEAAKKVWAARKERVKQKQNEVLAEVGSSASSSSRPAGGKERVFSTLSDR